MTAMVMIMTLSGNGVTALGVGVNVLRGGVNALAAVAMVMADS